MAELTTRLIAQLVDKVSGPARAASQSMRSFYKSAGDGAGLSRVNERMAAVNRRLDRVRGSMLETAAAAYALKSALQAPIQAAVDFETKLTDIGQKSGKTREQMLAFGLDMRKLAPVINQSAGDIATAMDELVGKGLKFRDAAAALPVIGKASTAFRTDMKDLSEAATATLNNLNVPVEKLGEAINIMAAAGNAGAFELKDMAKEMPTVGAAAQMAGMKGTGAVLELASALQIVRNSSASASEAANNLANLLQKMRSDEVVNQFKKLGGIDLKASLDKRIKAGMSPLMAIVDVTQKTIAKSKGKIRVSDLFHDTQAQRAIQSLQENSEQFQEVMQKTRETYSGLTDAQFDERMKDMAQSWKSLSIAVERFNIAVGMSVGRVIMPAVTAIVNLGTQVAALAERFPYITSGLTLAIGGLIGLRFASVAAVWAFLQMQAGWLVAVAALTRGAAIVQTAWAVVRVGSALMAVAVSEAFAGMAATAAASVGGVVSAAAAIGRAFVALGAAIAASPVGWVAAAAAAIAAVGYLVWNNWDKITGWVTRGTEAAKSAASGLLDGVLKKAGEWGAEIADAFRNVVGWISGAFISFDWSSVGARIISGITSGIAAAWSAVTGWIKRALQTATGMTGGLMAETQNQAAGWGAGISDAFAKVVSSIGDTFLSFNWSSVGGGVVSGIGRGVSAGWGALASWAASALQSAGGMVGEFLTNANSRAAGWGADIAGVFRKAVDWIGQTFRGFDWQKVGGSVVSGISSGVSQAWGAVAQWAQRALRSATDVTGGFLDAAKRRTSEWGASIRSAFETVARRISDVFTQTDWLKVGRDILSGIWDGIRNSWFGFSSWLADTVRKLGGMLVGSAQASVGGSGTSMSGDTGGGAGAGGAGGAGGGVSGTEAPAPGEPGQYRPVYKLTNDDLSNDVVNKVAGEAIANNQTSVDAVINNMMNRVGTKAYGPSGNLRQVALAPGQYAGYRRAGAAEAEFIRSRIRAIASGAVPDNTGGANEYRAASYMGPWGRKHANAPVIGGNRFAYNPAGGVGPYAAYKEPRVGQGAVPQGNDAPGSGRQQITALGRELQAQGIRVSEHPAFGGVAPVHKGRAHYEGRAIDLNIGRRVTEAFSPFAKRFDALAASLRDRGYKVIWRAPGHFNHMHVEAPASGVPGRAAPPAATAVAGRAGAPAAPAGGQGVRRIFDRNQQRASRDKTSSNVHFNPVVTVHAGQGVDSRDVERRVHAVMRNEVRTLFRGSYTDTDFATA